MSPRFASHQFAALFGKRTARFARVVRAGRRATITSAEQLESRQMLAFQYLGFTHTNVPVNPTSQAYQYNFEIFQSDPGDSAVMYMRNMNNTGFLEFAYDTAFNALANPGIGTNNGTSLPPVGATGTVGPARLVNTNSFAASYNVTPPTTETFYLSKVRVAARAGTVNPTFVLHVGDSMPLSLEVDFSQAVGTGTIIINSSAQETYNAASPATALPNAGAGYTFLGSQIRIQAALTPRYSNDYRATDLIRIENAITGGLNARVADGNFELIAGASIQGAVNVVTGGGVPPTANSAFASYGYGTNGGDILIDGAINSGSTVVLQTYSVDPRIIRTGSTGYIQGATSITLNNAGADGGVINVETRGFTQHNIYAGSASNQTADIGIQIRQTSGDLTLNALPASRGKIDLRATAADGDVIINSNVDTIGALALTAPTLNIGRPLSTASGDITLTGGTVTLNSNVTAGRSGIGDLVVTANTGAINVTSAAVVQAPGDTMRFSATGGITSQATLTADGLSLTAGGAIDVNTAVATITAQAGGAITIDETDGVVIESIATKAAGAITVTAGGVLDLVDMATAGTGDITATTTAGGLLARDLSTQNGNVVLTASSGDIEARGDVFVNGTSKDFTLNATTGNIVMSPLSTFTVADQLVFNAPAGRVLTPGTISSVSVTSAGTGYTSAPTVSFNSGSGATVAPVVGSQQVTFVRVTQGGSGYVSAPAVVFGNAGTGGAGAAATSILQNGVVVGVNITSGGANYTTAPTISFVGGGGSGATAEASIDGLTAINTSAQGSGYLVPPTVVISSGDGGTTAAVKVDATGSITGINLSQPGGSYNAAPTVVITDTSGSGFGATATATISGGVSGGIVTAGGSGYDATTTVTFSGATGTGATGLPLLGLTNASIGAATAGTNYRSGDLLTVLAGTGAHVAVTGIVNGGVSSVSVGAPGTGYTTATVTISAPSGGGVQATATATISGGEVTGITITNPGSGYTSAPMVTIAGDGTGAAATAVLGQGIVTSLQVLDGGADYSVGDVLYLNDVALGATGLQATVSAVSTGGTVTGLAVAAGGTSYTTAMRLGHVGGTGGVLQVDFGLAAIGTTITPSSGGTGYTTAPTVTIAGGGGSGATATATINGSGVVTAVTITNPGTGYKARPIILFSGGGGTGATATAPVPPNALTSPLATLSVFRAGSGYTNRPTRVVGGSGSGGAITFNDTNYTIVGYQVVKPGSGYQSASAPTISFGNTGGGTGAAITPSISGVVTGISVTSAGSAYNPATTQIQITPVATGSGASGRAISVNGVGGVTAVNVATPGAGYVAAPRVTIVDRSGSGFGAAATASISQGVTSIALTNAGSGYTSAPTVTISGGSGTGATAIATVSGGFVTGITITNPGSGYTSTPTVSFSGGGSGSGATATASTSNVVTAITMTSSGVGYNPDTTEVSLDPIGSGATAVANLTNGQVTSIKITDNGSGYSTSTAPTVTLVPYGSAALATSSLSGTGVGSVTVTAPGVNYAVPPVVQFSGGGGAGAAATATVGSVAQLSAARLSWTAIEQPLDALLDQFAVAKIVLTGAGDLNVTRSSGDLVLEGAQTKDGSIRIAAQSLTVTGPAIAGDFNTSRSETVSLEALGGNLSLQAAVTAPATVTLKAGSGSITGTATNIVTAKDLVISALSGITLQTAVETVRGGVSGNSAPLTITESDAITLGIGTGAGQTLFATNGAISVTNLSGDLAVQRVDAGLTGSVTLAAAVNLIEAAASTTTAEVIAASATLSSASGRIDLDTDVQTLTASAALATVTVNNLGASQFAVTSATARNDVTVTAVSAMQVTAATSALNNVSLITSGTGSNLTVGAISAPIGVVMLDSSADIAQGALTGLVSATGARLRAVGSATLRTAVGTLGATTGTGLAITETDAITLAEIGAGVPPDFARVQSTAGSVSVLAGDAISALVVVAPQGDVSLTSTNAGIAVDSITAGTTAGIVTLLAAQSITDNDGLVDISGFRAVVTSTAGSIGAINDPLDLTVGELTATATAGSVDVSETDGLVVTGLTATSASLVVAGSVTQAGTINAATLAVRTTAPGSTVSLVNPANSVSSLSGGTTAGTFDFVNAGDLTVIAPGVVAGTAAAGDGNIQLTSQNGNLTIVSNLTAQNDVVVLNAVNGTISQQAGSVIDAGLLRWNARSATFNGTIPATVVGPPQPGQSQIGPAVPGQTLVVTAGNYTGDLVIVNSGNIQIDGVVTATGTITVTSQTAGITFGAAGRLDGTSVSLNAVTTSQLVVGGGVPVSATVSSGGLSLSSPGSLRQNGAITASALSATAGSGAIVLDNPSNSVGAFSASAPHAGGNVVFVNATGFSVAAPGITAGTATVGDGFVSLWAVSGDLTVAAPIEAPGDVVQLRAGGTVVVSAQINAQSRVIIDSSGVIAEPIPVSTGQAFVDSVALINSLPPIVGGYQIVVTSSLVLPQTLTFRNTIALSGAAGVVVDGGGVLANGIVIDTDPQDSTKTGSLSRITNLAFANFTGAAVTVNGAQNVAIQGLTVTDSATGLLLNGMVNGTTVRGSTFRNVQTAMQLTGAQRATIGGTATSQRNRIEGASRAGVLATGFCTGTRIIGTTFTANPRTRTQFNVRSSRGLRISGTTVERAPRVVRAPINLFGR